MRIYAQHCWDNEQLRRTYHQGTEGFHRTERGAPSYYVPGSRWPPNRTLSMLRFRYVRQVLSDVFLRLDRKSASCLRNRQTLLIAPAQAHVHAGGYPVVRIGRHDADAPDAAMYEPECGLHLACQ